MWDSEDLQISIIIKLLFGNYSNQKLVKYMSLRRTHKNFSTNVGKKVKYILMSQTSRTTTSFPATSSCATVENTKRTSTPNIF